MLWYSPSDAVRHLAAPNIAPVWKFQTRQVRSPVRAMFDIHYHLLFGVDDGPATLEESLRLVEASIAEGATHIVCTPHANHRYRFDPATNERHLAILRERLDGRIELGIGCDFHMSLENIEDAVRNPAKYTINGRQYLLVELPEFFLFQSISDRLRQLSAHGMVPIITHPERNRLLRTEPGYLDQWIGDGCLVQVTAGAVLGRFGRGVEGFSNHLISRNRVHLIASDAHSMEWRPPAMAGAFEWLKIHHGPEMAELLSIRNPRAVFFGEAIRDRPEDAERHTHARNHRLGILGRVFRRRG